MKLKVSYKELVSVLGNVNTILSDKTVDEKIKNAIFLVTKDSATMVGYSPLTFERTALQSVEVEEVEDTWEFQVKAGELTKILSSYSTLFKTKVETVEFEKNNNKIKVLVYEEPINEEDSRLAQVGKFNMDNVPMNESIKSEIRMEFPDSPDVIDSSDLLLYIDSLFPLMTNDSSSSISSKINFAEDYVFVITSYMNSFFKNKLPDAFKGLTLGFSSVNFLKSLCLGAESINVQRIDKYLCLESGNIQAFFRYQAVKIKHDLYLKKINDENGIVLDRLYLKDVLKRMLVSDVNGTMKLTDEGVEVTNDDFSQIVPVNNKKGSVDDIKVKISVPVLIKSIIGDDAVLPDQLFVYFIKSGSSSYLLYIKDKTGAWFSTTTVQSR